LTPSALGNWVRQARADRTKGKTGLTTEERAELAKLRKEKSRLRMERDILKKSRAFFRQEPGVVVAWIEAEKAEYPVTTLCKFLRLVPKRLLRCAREAESKHVVDDRRLLC